MVIRVRTSSVVFCLFIIFLFGVLLSASISELNPDWFGYKAIYESQGAWLEDSGRDSLYVIANQVFNQIFGDGAYEDFRWTLASFFFVYIAFLVSGFVLPLSWGRLSYALFGVALVFLGMLRFTVQIREGIAISLVVLALGLIIRAAAISRIARLLYLGGVLLLVVAPFFHSSTFSIFVVFLASLWVGAQGSGHDSRRLKSLWMLAFLMAAFFALQLKFNFLIGAFFNEKGGDREVLGDASLVEQLLRIASYGVVCFLIWHAGKSKSLVQNIPNSFRSFFLVLTGPAQVSSLLLTFFAIYIGLSKLILADLMRQLVMFISLGLLLVSVFGYKNRMLVAASIVLILDGVRAVVASVYTTHGIQVF